MKREETAARVLVVDDNRDNVEVVTQLLEACGFTSVRSVLDPTKAIGIIEEWDPDVLLLDLHMPGMSGFEVMAALRKSQAKDDFLPILVFTADWTLGALQKAYDHGAHDFITKPFDMVELVARIRNFARMRQMHRDLTERNAALERSEAEVRAANRELEGFTHSISHDLRGPLRAIMSTCQMLIEDCEGLIPSESLGLLERQAGNAKKLNTIVDELLKHSKISRAQMEIIDLDLTQIARDVAGELGNEQDFRIEPGMQGRGDPLLVRLVFLNLMSNAVKFSPGDKFIEIGMQNGAVFVRDRGIGFEQKEGEKLFLPFERLVSDKEFPGTGIGLANVKRIIDKHGGRIWAESEPGRGATFSFTLSEP